MAGQSLVTNPHRPAKIPVMPKAAHLKKGQQAEALALAYLQKKGLRLITRNYRTRRGEIDLIMDDHDTLVFVEVRYRNSEAFGGALESVTHQKQARLIACASHYLSKTEMDQASRFDVVAISTDGHQPVIEWVADAFQC